MEEGEQVDIPSNKDMPWLTEETEEEKELLKVAWVLCNKNMVPLDELEVGKEYRLVYVYDSGVSTKLAEVFKNNSYSDLKPLDILYYSAVLKHVTSLGGHCIEVYDKNVLVCKLTCADFNYGKSWRLKRI